MEEQRPKKRPRSSAQKKQQIPTFTTGDPHLLAATVETKEFVQAWKTFQVVFLPREGNSSSTTTFTWKHIHDVFENLSETDKESFCIETDASKNDQQQQQQQQQQSSEQQPPPQSFFQVGASENQPYYCSFLVQNDDASLQKLLSRVPVSTLHTQWSHEPCVWTFFGRNPASSNRSDDDDNTSKNNDLQGRPEHTDSVSHDGTWHYQLSGNKRWMLRPTAKLLEQWKTEGVLSKEEMAQWEGDDDESSPPSGHRHITVDCRQGDVLVINTRLWFHQTILPPQPDPSVSYARDFWARTKPSDATSDQQQKQGTSTKDSTGSGCMTNVDGLYATDDIAAGTIIFRENDMPDCELHRSSENPNCDVVELEDGTGAVVSSRIIVAGEFFCIAESEDEDEEEEDEEGSDDEGDFEDVDDEE
jgi:hypothetical protein